jgi:hypothetical protein
MKAESCHCSSEFSGRELQRMHDFLLVPKLKLALKRNFVMSSHFRNSHVRTSANTTNNCPFTGVMTSCYMGTAWNRG